MASNKLRVQAYNYVMILLCASIHIFIGVYFTFLGIYSIVALSVFDVSVYLIAFFINKAGKTRLTGFIVTFKVITYSFIATILFGAGVNAQLLALAAMLPAALHLDFTKMQRICIVASIPFIINLQLLLPTMLTPILDMSDDMFLGIFFANVVALGSIASVALNTVITGKIAERHAKEIDNFKHISNTDPLTGLNNRRYAENFFEKLTDEDFPLLFGMIDIDDFKHVNDTFGHEAGDAVLKSVAEILRNNSRKTDLACRWGGEEFLIGLSKCSLERGLGILEKIRHIIEHEVINTESGGIKITITCGVAAATDGDIKTALSECDKKLYDGKRSGKNQIVV